QDPLPCELHRLLPSSFHEDSPASTRNDTPSVASAIRPRSRLELGGASSPSGPSPTLEIGKPRKRRARKAGGPDRGRFILRGRGTTERRYNEHRDLSCETAEQRLVAAQFGQCDAPRSRPRLPRRAW